MSKIDGESPVGDGMVAAPIYQAAVNGRREFRAARLARLLRLAHSALDTLADKVGHDGPLGHLIADIEAELPELREQRLVRAAALIVAEGLELGVTIAEQGARCVCYVEREAFAPDGVVLMQAFKRRFGRRFSPRDNMFWLRRGRIDEAVFMTCHWQNTLFKVPKTTLAGPKGRNAYRNALHWLRHWRVQIRRHSALSR